MRGRPTVNVDCVTLRTGGPERTKQGKDAASTLFPLFTFWLTITWTCLLCSATHYLPWQTGLTETMSRKSKQNKTIQYKKAASSQVVCLFVCFFSGKKSLKQLKLFPGLSYCAPCCSGHEGEALMLKFLGYFPWKMIVGSSSFYF